MCNEIKTKKTFWPGKIGIIMKLVMATMIVWVDVDGDAYRYDNDNDDDGHLYNDDDDDDDDCAKSRDQAWPD